MKPVWQSVLASTFVSLSLLSAYHFSGLGNSPAASPTASVPGLFAEPTTNRLVNFADEGASTAPFDFREAASVAMPAVVHIKSIRTVTQTIYDPFYEFFGRAPRQYNNRQQVSSGSGVIIGTEGYIVTNNHVIKDADQLTVTLFDNRSYTAIVIGTDPSTDLGLIKIEAGNLPILPFANSDEVMVGEWVLAVGNPFSLSSTATAGIVSAIGRDLQIIEDKMAIESFIQTDAAVNPGNSGGALVDLKGNLIGVNTAIASPTGTYAGYAFAVPANIVRKVVNDLKAYDRVQRAFLGVVSGENLNSSIAGDLGITLNEGVLVKKLSELGGAYKAGIREGDVIVEVDGLPVKSDAKLLEMVGRHSPGDVISVKIARNNAFKTYSVTLTDSQGSTELNNSTRDEFLTVLGMDLRDLTEEELGTLGIQQGVLVEKLYAGKVRQNSDMRENFIVLQVNGQQVSSADELTRALSSTVGEAKLLGFYPRINRMYEYAIPLGE